VLCQVLEQSDLAALCPVDVLEDEDGWLGETGAFDEASRGEEQQQHLWHPVIGSQAQEEREIADRVGDLGLGHELLDRELELFASNRQWVRLQDAARLVNDARERLVSRLLLVR